MRKLKMTSLLKRKGVDIKVWSADRLKGGGVLDGVLVKLTTASVEPELRHDPVIPYSTNSHLAMFEPGGIQVNVDLLWFSTGVYPDNTVVEISSQGGQYKVMGSNNYTDYSDVLVYELKGDDHNQPVSNGSQTTNTLPQ